jgi:NADH-quinone oxidoreductase subunit M
MVFFGSFKSALPSAKVYTVVATLGVVLGAAYILVMIQKIFLGKPREKHEHPLHEPNRREWLMLAPLAAIAIWIGVYPRPAIDIIDKDVSKWCHAQTGKAE